MDQMNAEIKQRAEEIDHKKEEFDFHLHELHKCQEVICKFQEDRNNILAKSAEFETRYEQAQVSLKLERERQANMHKLHLKLLAARQLMESL
jgi:hypothetical protein